MIFNQQKLNLAKKKKLLTNFGKTKDVSAKDVCVCVWLWTKIN